VALSHMSPLSHVLPCFPILIQSSLHLVIFKHPYLTHTKSNSRNLKCYKLSASYSSHLLFRYPPTTLACEPKDASVRAVSGDV
jgi:hypothetical protein